MEKEEEQQEEEQEGWSRARIVFGRLIEIDKKDESITLEYKDGINWTSESFSTKDFSDEDYDKLNDVLGEDVEITVKDHQVTLYDVSPH